MLQKFKHFNHYMSLTFPSIQALSWSICRVNQSFAGQDEGPEQVVFVQKLVSLRVWNRMTKAVL